MRLPPVEDVRGHDEGPDKLTKRRQYVILLLEKFVVAVPRFIVSGGRERAYLSTGFFMERSFYKILQIRQLGGSRVRRSGRKSDNLGPADGLTERVSRRSLAENDTKSIIGRVFLSE